jgi:hypothetical protein
MKIDGLTLQTLRGWMGGSVVVQMVSPFHTVEGILHDADINTLMVKSNGQNLPAELEICREYIHRRSGGIRWV